MLKFHFGAWRGRIVKTGWVIGLGWGSSVLLAGLLSAEMARAADAADIALGRALAEAKCSHCHAVGADGESPHSITPPFREFRDAYPIPMLIDAAQTGVFAGHDEMPMFEFSREEARALLAYIDSLNPGEPPYVGKDRK